ncbi:MAG: stalk domain-containing protein [Tissierellia bacterium]|nr:stalk domain-containing protein [Tissierellia bacterium]MDD4726195.1 stalk domain-containing protein [Tissierellia bacterium]
MKNSKILLMLLIGLAIILPATAYAENGVLVQGFTETKNLVNVVEEDVVFERLGAGGVNQPFLNGKYKVEIWDENTSIDYRIEKGDIHSKGFLIKQNGIMASASSWNGEAFNISKRQEKSPSYFKYGTIKAGRTDLVIDGQGNRYNQDSPELYAYILFENVPEGQEIDYNDFYKFYTLKIIKYDINNVSKAIPTSSKILVNNVEKSLEAYTINDNNYFKLRDLAQIVNGTEKQFNVNWNNENNSIELIPRTVYVSVGGELSEGNGQTKDAELSDSRIFVGYETISPTAYNINGNNYVKLRDVAKEFNIGITWDGATNTIGIDTTINYVD